MVNRKSVILVVLIVSLLALASAAAGALRVQKIEAHLAHDIGFRLDGQPWQPVDLDGTILTPIIYRGRSYVPARALLEEKGVAVGFDSNTRTITLDYPETVVPLTAGTETVTHRGAAVKAKTITATAGQSSPALSRLVHKITVPLSDDSLILVDGKELSQPPGELAQSRRVFSPDSVRLYLNENGEAFRASLTGDNPGGGQPGIRIRIEVTVTCCPAAIVITIYF